MKTRKAPVMTTDEAAEAFFEQKLSDLGYRQIKPATWKAEPKIARLTMRLPESPLSAVKAAPPNVAYPTSA